MGNSFNNGDRFTCLAVAVASPGSVPYTSWCRAAIELRLPARTYGFTPACAGTRRGTSRLPGAVLIRLYSGEVQQLQRPPATDRVPQRPASAHNDPWCPIRRELRIKTCHKRRMPFTDGSRLLTLRTMKGMRKYWGFVALAGLVVAWTAGAAWSLIVVLSALSAIYFTFQAPFWCCAVNRDGSLCRKNSSGILMGCSLRQHKWQKMKMVLIPHGWKTLNRGLWGSPTQGVTTLAGLATVVSGVVSVIALLV